MAASIAVIDYRAGNLASVHRALVDAGYDAFITQDPRAIASADGMVLPGVGAFSDAVSTMNELGQMQVIRERVAGGIPFLGICLGLHLVLDWGDEGCADGKRAAGLGLVPGRVERMSAYDAQGIKYKIPHVGWNSVSLYGKNPLMDGIAQGSYFYFTHSYCGKLYDEQDIIGRTTHAQPFVSALCRGSVYAVQFHPEKSSAVGLRVLKNFGALVEAAR